MSESWDFGESSKVTGDKKIEFDNNFGMDIARLEALPLEATVKYRNEALIPESLRDIIPSKGEKTEFPFLMGIPNNRSVSYLRLAIREGHSRSAVLGSCDVTDEFGNHYVFMDVKGTGTSGLVLVVTSTGNGEKSENYMETADWSGGSGSQDPQGLFTAAFAKDDLKYSTIFAKLGIGGCRIVALIEPDKLPIRNSKNEIELVSNKKLINPQSKEMHATPGKAVFAFRIFTEKLRMFECKKSNLPELFARLNTRFGTELKTAPEYLNWLSMRVGRNLAIMHNHRYAHRFPSRHNILADGLLMDNDGVVGPEDYGLPAHQITKDSELLDPIFEHKTFGECVEMDLDDVTTVIEFTALQLGFRDADLLKGILLNTYDKNRKS